MVNPNRAIAILDEMAFGLATEAGMLGSPTVTIELPRRGAEMFLSKVAEGVTKVLMTHHRDLPDFRLGRPFLYRGVNFRIVEKAEHSL